MCEGGRQGEPTQLLLSRPPLISSSVLDLHFVPVNSKRTLSHTLSWRLDLTLSVSLHASVGGRKYVCKQINKEYNFKQRLLL